MALGAIAIGVIVGFALIYVVGGIVLLKVLVTPGGVDWSGANNPNPPADPLVLNYRGDPRKAFGFDFSTVHYPTELGDAEAYLVPGARNSGLQAIFVHGIGGIRENGYKQLSVLHEAGIPTLLITYRNDAGAPASPNALFSFGVTEWRDLEAAVDWMRAQGAARILLVADSMGAGIVGQYLMHAADTAPIVALALDAPALDFRGLVAGNLGRYYLPFPRAMARLGTRAIALMTGTDLAMATSVDAVAAFDGPLFLAHGRGDLMVPFSLSETLLAKRTAPTIFLRTGATHLFSFNENPERYRTAFLELLSGIAG